MVETIEGIVSILKEGGPIPATSAVKAGDIYMILSAESEGGMPIKDSFGNDTFKAIVDCEKQEDGTCLLAGKPVNIGQGIAKRSHTWKVFIKEIESAPAKKKKEKKLTLVETKEEAKPIKEVFEKVAEKAEDALTKLADTEEYKREYTSTRTVGELVKEVAKAAEETEQSVVVAPPKKKKSKKKKRVKKERKEE